MLSDPKTQIGTNADCRATDPKLPEDWICPTPNDVCISLQNGESAYCCPANHDCTYVPPVPSVWKSKPHLHRVTVVPDNTTFFMLNAFNTTVAECGGDGCPSLGYNCEQRPFAEVEEPRCVLIGMYAITPNKASAPGANLTYKATEDKPANAGSPNAPLNVTTSTNINQTQEPNTTQGHGGAHANAAVIAGATIATAVGIVAVVFAVMIYLRYMRKAAAAQEEKDKEKESNSESGSSGGTGYWSYDGRRDANGRLSRKWSDSTLQ